MDTDREDQGKEKTDEGYGLTPRQSLSFWLPNWSLSAGSLQKELAMLAKPLTCILAPRVQKELKSLSHFFAICCKFKATRDKAFFMGESEKKKRPLVILLIPRKHNSTGGRVREQKPEEGRKCVTKIPPSTSKQF